MTIPERAIELVSQFHASMCDLLGGGEVIAYDLSLRLVHPRLLSHPRVKLLDGSSVDPAIHAAIAAHCHGRRTMVILDSDHATAHVLKELRLYDPLVESDHDNRGTFEHDNRWFAPRAAGGLNRRVAA